LSDNIFPIIRPPSKVCCFLKTHASRPTYIVFSESKKGYAEFSLAQIGICVKSARAVTFDSSRTSTQALR
jgi:hypothetical protein